MSGNIHDTNVQTIRKQIDDLVVDLKQLTDSNETVSDWTESLQRKYKQLHRTSSTLFKFIITNYGTTNFNEAFFNQTIDMMLNKITNIQSYHISQEDASANVGTHLANTFIPQMNQK